MSEPRITAKQLRALAETERQARPWRYYHLDREVLQKMVEQQADTIERLTAELAKVKQERDDGWKLCIAASAIYDVRQEEILIRAEKAETRERQAFAAGFDAGFDDSGEGWNAEYPFGSSLLSESTGKAYAERYERDKEKALAAYLASTQESR